MLADTKAMAMVLRKPSTHLKDLAWAELGIKQTRFEEVDWNDIEQVARYGAADSDITLRLFNTFNRVLDEQPTLRHVYEELELPCIPILAAMERHGVLVDPAPLRALAVALTARTAVLDAELREWIDPSFSLSSHDQLAEALFGPARWRVKPGAVLKGRLLKEFKEEGLRTGAQTKVIYIAPGLGLKSKKRTKEGAPATDINTLRALDHPCVDKLVELASIRQALSGNVGRLPELVQEDGRVHTTFRQAGGAEEAGLEEGEAQETGRVGSSGPNLQQVTHHGDDARPYVAEWGGVIRKAIIAPLGYRLVKVDAGQEEPRIGAALSGDNVLRFDLEHGDVYCTTATLEYGRTITKADVEERQIGKRSFMAWLNRAGSYGIRKSAFWLTEAEGWGVVGGLRDRYKQFEWWCAEQVAFLEQHGYVETYFGRRIDIPKIATGNRQDREAAMRECIPGAIQGTAADLCKIMLRRVAEGLPDDAHLILAVHDELVVEVPEGKVDEVVELCYHCLDGVLPVVIPAEVSVGKSWGEMERRK